MILKGMKKYNNNNNDIDPLKYLYCLQKRDINYNELSTEIKAEINESEFNKKNFSQKFELKFKYYKE